jgi:Ca2+-binding EF-hand superfamily protein
MSATHSTRVTCERVRPGGLGMRFVRTLVLAAALGLGAFVARAADDAPSHDPKLAFAETDENHDGHVDRPEFVARLVEIFFHGDRDKDGSLTVTEMEAVVAFPEDFRSADTSGDGKLSMPEFLRVRAGTFDEADADANGMLSLDEVVAVYERKASAP